MAEDLAWDAFSALTYSLVGVALMVLGFILVDVITPGDLRRQIWVDRNPNATLLVASNLIGVALINATAIWTSHGSLGQALLSSAVYGVIGLAAMALAFMLIDLFTPGNLRNLVAEPELHPAAYVSAAAHMGIGLVVAAGLS